VRNDIEELPVTAPVRAALVVFFAAWFFMLAALSPSRAETAIQEVTSPSGVTAWLVEDYSVPIVAIRFIFEGGTTQDPQGKEGLMRLMSGLFDEGAGELDADAFQLALDDAGAEMGFNAGVDGMSGSMRTLAETRGEAFGLLALALNSPRFDQAPMERIRGQLITAIEASARDPETQAGVAFSKALYGDHPYARRDDGLVETLRTVTADDLRQLHRKVFARGKLHVGVVGAIDAATLAQELDRIFGALPAEPDLAPVPDVEPKLAQEVRVDYPLPQTTIRLAFPGVARDDPDFFAAFIMNHILGGGTFSSRLFDEVREKRGLTYGIGSSLSTPRHSSSLSIGTSTNADRAAETLSVVREVVAKMAAEGPTEAELEDAKRYLIGSYAINNLDSSSAIANTLVVLQVEGLGIDYIRRRPELINAVTREKAAEMARRLLTAEPAVLILGPAADGG
jgi:zinc protease